MYSFFDLLNFDLAEALDLQECSAGGTVDGLDGVLSALKSIITFNGWVCKSYCHSVEAVGFEFGDISCTDTMGLDAVNVHDEVLPIYNWISHRRKGYHGG